MHTLTHTHLYLEINRKMALRAGNGAVRSVYFSTTFARRETENEAPPISIVCESVCCFFRFRFFGFCSAFYFCRSENGETVKCKIYHFDSLFFGNSKPTYQLSALLLAAGAAPTYRIQILEFTIHIHYFPTHGIFSCRVVVVFAR